jgi:UDP-glucuronate 4-epimerase
VRVVVTGAAGFIGSQLSSYLASNGDDVVGIDNLASYYDVQQKRRNLESATAHRKFTFVEVDLRHAPLEQFLEGVDVVYHQAAQPGVRTSWSSFPSYVENNVLATQRLLEAARACRVGGFVYASSSSAYGNAETYPTLETAVPEPHSPYGVTKLAAEQLVRLYGENWGLPTVSLRYFTVYGPGQRPDMAFHRLIHSALTSSFFPLYGDGKQIRDYTFVEDVVRANHLAATSGIAPGTLLNIAGGTQTDLNEVIDVISTLVGVAPRLQQMGSQAGDITRTGGDTTRARELLGWEPLVELREGLEAQVAWHRKILNVT